MYWQLLRSQIKTGQKYQFLIMESNKQVTIAERNYFRPGTYLSKYRQQLGNAGIANVIATTLLAPLERWRIIAQTQRAYPLRPKRFDNFFNYISRLPKEQGVLSFWRGNSTSLLIYLYQTIIQIGFYDSIKKQAQGLKAEVGQDSIFGALFDNVLYPSLASFVTLAFIHPLDTYRIHLTMRYHKDKFDSPFNKLRDRFYQIGFKGLYKGFILSNVISLIHFNLYKRLYDTTDNIEIDGVPSDIINKQLILSTVAVAAVHPLDTLRKIYQLNNMHKPGIFNSYRDVLKYLQQNKATRTLFNGFTASLTKNALFITIYWQILKLWRNSDNSKAA